MRIYGWDDTGPYRGELLAARVDSSILKLGLDCVAGDVPEMSGRRRQEQRPCS